MKAKPDKKCYGCSLVFPRTDEYFFKKKITNQLKNRIAVYWSWRSLCKTCHGKKGNDLRVKKRCIELNCETHDYRKMWKAQFTATRSKDLEAKKILSKICKTKYQQFLLRLSKDNSLTLDEYIKNVESNSYRLEMYKNKTKSKEHHRLYRNEYYKKDRLKLKDAYVCNNVLGLKVNEVPEEIIEMTRLLVELKREIKN